MLNARSFRRPAQRLATLLFAALALIAYAQEKYPSRPIEFNAIPAKTLETMRAELDGLPGS